MQDCNQHHQQEQEQSLHLAAHMNNSAACLIENHKYKTAVNQLNEALKICQPYIDRCLPDHSNVQQLSQDDLMLQVGKCMRIPSAPFEMQTFCGTSGDGTSPVNLDGNIETDGAYVYRHPIVIPQKCVSLLLINHDHNSKYSNAINLSLACIFNMALAYNLFATELEVQDGLPDVCRQALYKSARLYELAHSILSRHNIPCGALYLMALVNNLGQNYQMLGQEKQAIKVFRHLLSSLIHLTVNYDCSDIASLSGFFRNTFVLMLQEPPCAAAA